MVQDPDFDGADTVLEAVFSSDNPMMAALRDYEEALILQDKPEKMEAALVKMDDLKAWDFESKFKEILFKLNMTNLNQPISELSGGQKKRLALAKLIIDDPEFLILDEPTNHLDLEMIEWLEEYFTAKSNYFINGYARPLFFGKSSVVILSNWMVGFYIVIKALILIF